MNQQPLGTDKGPEDPALSGLYRRASQEQPPAELDARILAAARNATPTRRKEFWRWSAPLASAALVLLGLSLMLRVGQEIPEQITPLLKEPETGSIDKIEPRLRHQRDAAPTAVDYLAAPLVGASAEQDAAPAPKTLFAPRLPTSAAAEGISAVAPAQEARETQPLMNQEIADRLGQVRALYSAGQIEQGKALLEQLLQAYPELEVPPDLESMP